MQRGLPASKVFTTFPDLQEKVESSILKATFKQLPEPVFGHAKILLFSSNNLHLFLTSRYANKI